MSIDADGDAAGRSRTTGRDAPVERTILVLTSNFPRWEGDSTTPFVLHLAQDLQDLGWRTDVLAPHAAGAATRENLGGVRVRRFRYLWPESQQTVCYGGGALVNLRKNRVNGLKLPLLVAAEWAALARLLASRRYAAVHAHWILPQGFVTGLVPGRRTARLVTVHGGDIFGLQTGPLAPPKRFALRAGDAVTVNSRATGAAVRELAPKIDPVQIPIGVTERDPDGQLVEKLRRHHRRGDGPLIVFVGRLVDEKGVGDLLEAVAELRHDLPDTTALIIGEGQDRRAFEAQAGALGVEDNVTFTGWVAPDEISSYLAAADVFVGPSRRAEDGWVEAQGLTFAEAMMAGVPVVATALGGIVDAIQDGETGFLVDERAPEQIARVIRTISAAPAEAQEIASRGQTIAREKFGRQQSAQRFSDLLDELIASKRS